MQRVDELDWRQVEVRKEGRERGKQEGRQGKQDRGRSRVCSWGLDVCRGAGGGGMGC